jgi:hypothetical protein
MNWSTKKAKQKEENADVTYDWLHHVIIRQIDHALPDVMTTAGSYAEIGVHDFQEVLDQAKQAIEDMDLGVTSKGVLEQLVLFRAAELMSGLLETRNIHTREAIYLRTDVEMFLDKNQAKITRMEEERALLQQEIDALQAEQ